MAPELIGRVALNSHRDSQQIINSHAAAVAESFSIGAPIWGDLGGFDPVLLADETKALQQREELERRDRIRQEKILRYLADSCIGERFRGKTFDDYQPVNQPAAIILNACREYAAQFDPRRSPPMIFVGASGTGKNMLSAVIGQAIIQHGFSFLHTTAIKVVRKYKDSWKQPDVTEESVLRYFVWPDLLVIDEIGVQFNSPTEQLYLTELVNDRYEAMKPTILLSNLTGKQVEDCLGGRVIDRFQENGGRVLVFNWSSYRRNRPQ